MRLVCPNCGAEYAVDGSVIPDTGRDVQCSSCGTTWFQEAPGATTSARRETLRRPARGTPGESLSPREEAIRIATMPPTMDESQVAKRRSLDSAVLDVLREEAQREKAARAAETPPPPPPPQAPEIDLTDEIIDLTDEATALEDVRPPSSYPDEKDFQIGLNASRAKSENNDPAAALAALSGRAANRSEMLPDIEKINSTLRASADPTRTTEEQSAEALEEARRKARKEFRLGFGVMVAIFLALTMLYIHGPKLTASVPALEKPVASYISTIDTARRWLDRNLRGTSEIDP